jgi:SAM-dependent methyltransferase
VTAPAVVPVARALSRSERLGLITRGLDMTGAGLEIGPSHNPLVPKSAGLNIRIADHLDRAGLVAKYEGYRPTGRIEDVDFVLGPGPLTDFISERFDYILASHVAEHTVCLICFLNECEKLLQPGGQLSLAIPDRRFCFDHFRERSALGRVIDVHDAGHSVHTRGSVLEHNLNMVDKAHAVAWFAAAPGALRWRVPLEAVLERAGKAADGEYVDTHNWVMTPSHFRLLLHDLHLLGFIGLRESSFTDTVDHEFFLTLSQDGCGPDVSRNELVRRSAAEAWVHHEVQFANESPSR